jgi:IS30 family transposase
MGTHYRHLKLDERRKLAKWLEAKMPISEMADRLGRDPSTIYRDIKRNRFTDDELPELNGYHALVAQAKYEQRRAIHRKMIIHPDLKAAISLSIVVAVGRVVPAGTTEPTYSTFKACHTGLSASQNAWNSAIGSAT